MFSSSEPAAPTYVMYEWSLEQRSAPILISKRTLELDLGTIVESMITEMANSQDPKVISFSPDLSCIRIGPRVFVKEETGNYVDLNNLELMTEESSPYFEHVELQKSTLLLASRTRLSAIIPKQDRKQKSVAVKVDKKTDADEQLKEESNIEETKNEETKNVSPDESKDKTSSETPSPSKDQADSPSDGEADDESATSTSNPDSSAWNSAEESWSEASSSADDDVDPALANLDSSEDESSEANDSETDSENDSKSSVKDDSSDAPVATQGVLYGDSSDDGERNLDWLDDNDSHDDDAKSDMDAGFSGSENSDAWDSDTDVFIRSYGRSRAKLLGNRGQQGMLMVYDLNNGHPVQLFKFSHLLISVLDNSPPAIHPTKPLVVWPLSGGDILFADYRANSYFIRTFKPSTRKGMYISLPFQSVSTII